MSYHFNARSQSDPNGKDQGMSEHEKIKQMWADPMFELLSDIDKMLESNRVWSGQAWSYQPIHPVRYIPVKDQVRAALDAMHARYGVEL